MSHYLKRCDAGRVTPAIAQALDFGVMQCFFMGWENVSASEATWEEACSSDLTWIKLDCSSGGMNINTLINFIYDSCSCMKHGARSWMTSCPYYWCCPVSRVLMHNLFLGYFHTPKTKRADVLRLMGSVLGLSREDVDKVRLTFKVFNWAIHVW